MDKSIDGSYKIDNFSENKESEVVRLKYQVELFYQKELALYKKLGLKDRMKIIECGSGPGYLIGNIINDLPESDATALEIDPYLVEHLNKNAMSDGKRLYNVKQASIYNTGLPDDFFDFAITRLVLEHLEDPGKAISEIRRILKPGGIFVVVSNDFAYHLLTFPPVPELDEMYDAYIRSRYKEGGDPLIARRLPDLLSKGKFTNVELNTICVHNSFVGDRAFLKAENVNISKSLVKGGFLKKETLESLMENWYNMLQTPGHVIFRQLFAVSGIKDELVENNTESDENEIQAREVSSLGLDKLGNLTLSEKKERIENHILEIVKAALDQPGIDVNTNTKLNEIDIDSITAAEISSVVKSEFETRIGIADILQKYSIKDITGQIIKDFKTTENDIDDSESSDESIWLEGQL
jgi:ubiquinone/menaquinone biosynthesis C-methylase UbiE/acyl carrier protein